MLIIKGHYFDGKTSTKLNVELICSASGELSFNEFPALKYQVDDVDISPRVGNTIRYIDFLDGSQFETEDNDAIDGILEKFKPNKIHNFIYKLEAARKTVIASLVILIVGGWAFIQYGIPYVSREVAMILPEETSHYLGQGILESLDEQWFEPSKLPTAQREELSQIFQQLAMSIGSPEITVAYRYSPVIGANAFALPNGVVVLTDQLIELASDNDEIIAIMLHELGHVEHRHLLRSMIQSFGMTFFVMAVSGDVSSGSTIIASAPLLFIKANYSQNMEIEADTYSLNYMRAHNIYPDYFVTIMEKLELSHSFEYSRCMKENEENDVQACLDYALDKIDGAKAKKKSILGYLSTHPSTKERIERFK